MADKYTKTTTSSSVLDGKNDRKNATLTPASSQLPNGVAGCGVNPKNVQILTKLANSLSESYQLVKQRQQKYKELNTKMGGIDAPQLISYTQDCDDPGAGEWQEVKNKLKRKKKLSASLTSVNDSVHQEKRTRIEGIQLNCRGKLHISELPKPVPQSATQSYVSVGVAQRAERWGGTKSNTSHNSAAAAPNKQMHANVVVSTAAGAVTATGATTAAPPPRLKRKLQENVQTIQKLNALTEQLRLEINELKSSLTTERGAVRVLRAQNESETRKWKNEVKRLQNAVELTKKNNTTPLVGAKKPPTEVSAENLPNAATAGNVTNYEVQRLTNEVLALKEANRALEERKMINGDADRRKAADMRTLRDTYEIRLTQLTKSAKTEISRLLEEIKTKERYIGQLKKELQTLQIRPQGQAEVKSRNATTNQQTTNKTTKPKKNNNNNKSKLNTTNNRSNETNASTSALAKKTEDSRTTTGGEAQHPNEVRGNY
ncbi:janus kinase and microtubule-interacting protein 2-like isoform X1 [Anastrepha ludens]|uniref:janus kinase and microtubule-interacting protein 2-like isoform X1 n=1 Tax=Anastrepha ludens TaxID=28586 RepID=UPI0023B13513|nr:janus kinase and microtubule-interacting protein 2-like isoform X1 [Anastrepha ludens]XP_053958838.1 janus kinase and microtubule-interacting protein 2-like isoform X1 [Anastrepha ludens]